MESEIFREEVSNLRFTKTKISNEFEHGLYAGQSISSIIERLVLGEISPMALQPLTVHRDKKSGVLWCHNNRSLYVLRMAGFETAQIDIHSDSPNNFDMLSFFRRRKLRDAEFVPKMASSSADKLAVIPPLTLLVLIFAAGYFSRSFVCKLRQRRLLKRDCRF